MRKRLEPGDIFNERYQIVGELGAGGMAVVYEALDLNTQRHRALKVMLPSMVGDDDLRRRFRQEATVAANIESDHIVEVIDAGIDDASSAPFLVLELLYGQPLDRLLESDGRLPAQRALTYLEQVGYALDKAHAANVVHRDLKPDNIFVTHRDDGSPCVKLLDFGIAKIISTTLSVQQTVGILGTPLYMAPEQIHADIDISPRTDVFALGHLAYTALVGEAYWAPEERSATTIVKLLMKLADGPKQAPTERALERVHVDLPKSFDAWFAQATADDPNGRFETATAAIRALGQALADAPPPRSRPPENTSHEPGLAMTAAPVTMPEQGLQAAAVGPMATIVMPSPNEPPADDPHAAPIAAAPAAQAHAAQAHAAEVHAAEVHAAEAHAAQAHAQARAAQAQAQAHAAQAQARAYAAQAHAAPAHLVQPGARAREPRGSHTLVSGSAPPPPPRSSRARWAVVAVAVVLVVIAAAALLMRT